MDSLNRKYLLNVSPSTYLTGFLAEPYIHLNGLLPNLTKNEGELLRLKCNVAGTLPIDFR